MRFARGDVEGALHDAESGVVAGRRSRDPQSLIPPLSFMAWLMLRTGREREANELLDELVQAVMRSPEENSAETQLALFTLGRQTDLLRLVDATAPTRWREILALIAADNLQAAADLYDELGMLADAALVRMPLLNVTLPRGGMTPRESNSRERSSSGDPSARRTSSRRPTLSLKSWKRPRPTPRSTRRRRLRADRAPVAAKRPRPISAEASGCRRVLLYRSAVA